MDMLIHTYMYIYVMYVCVHVTRFDARNFHHVKQQAILIRPDAV